MSRVIDCLVPESAGISLLGEELLKKDSVPWNSLVGLP